MEILPAEKLLQKKGYIIKKDKTLKRAGHGETPGVVPPDRKLRVEENLTDYV